MHSRRVTACTLGALPHALYAQEHRAQVADTKSVCAPMNHHPDTKSVCAPMNHHPDPQRAQAVAAAEGWRRGAEENARLAEEWREKAVRLERVAEEAQGEGARVSAALVDAMQRVDARCRV